MAQLAGRGEPHRPPARVAQHHRGVRSGLQRHGVRRKGRAHGGEYALRRRVTRHLVPAAQRDRPAGGDRDHRDGVGGRVGRIPEVLQHHHGLLVVSEGVRQGDRGVAAEFDLSRVAGQRRAGADADHLPVEQRNVLAVRRGRHRVPHVLQAGRRDHMSAVRIRESEAPGPGDEDHPASRPDGRAGRPVPWAPGRRCPGGGGPREQRGQQPHRCHHHRHPGEHARRPEQPPPPGQGRRLGIEGGETPPGLLALLETRHAATIKGVHHGEIKRHSPAGQRPVPSGVALSPQVQRRGCSAGKGRRNQPADGVEVGVLGQGRVLGHVLDHLLDIRPATRAALPPQSPGAGNRLCGLCRRSR